MKAYALEITAHTGTGLTTLYLSTAPSLVTGASDTPPNTTFSPRIIQPGNYTIQAFQDGKTYGKSAVGYGEIILQNNDSALDGLVDYGFDGRPAVLRMYDDAWNVSADYPKNWKTVYTGTIETIEATLPGYGTGTIVMRLRDRMLELHQKLPLAVYAGTNVLPNGLEGTANDLKGKTKPLLLGKCLNFTLQCVNTSKLIYAVSPPCGGLSDVVTNWDSISNFDGVVDFFGVVVSGAVVTPLGLEYRRGGCSSTGITVYDSGVTLTQGSNYTDENDMLTTAPSAGYYRVLPANGYIRLGSTPAGEITCTASDNNGHDANTAGSIIRAVLRDYVGWDSSRFNITELAAIDTDCPIPLGVLVTQDAYADEIIDQICQSVGACYYFDNYGVFRIFQVKDPAGYTNTIPFFDKIKSISMRSTMGIPNYQVRLRQQRNLTVQTSGLAGSTPVDWRAWVAQEYRENVATSATCKTKHLLSTELTFDSNFVADASSESTRRMQLYSVRRDMFEIEIDSELWSTSAVSNWDAISNFDAVSSVEPLDFTNLTVGQIIALGLNGRFGYTTKNMILTGITADLLNKKLTLTVWG